MNGLFLKMTDHFCCEDTRILRTIFTPPILGPFLKREPLMAKLKENSTKKLILIQAGPGSGKTFFAASFYYQLQDAIWISIPAECFSFLCILRHLVYALGEKPEYPKARELQKVYHLLSPEELFFELLKLFKDYITTDFYIFLDNYHHLKMSEEEVDKIVNLFLTFVPANIHLIVTSSENVRFPVARFRLNNSIFEITHKDLLLTIDETDEYLQLNGINLSLINLKTVYQFTEGWIGVLALLIDNLIESQNIEIDYLLRNSDQISQISQYLDKLLAKMPVEIQHFLIQTSPLNVIKVDLCNKYLNINNSQEMLNLLTAKNLIHCDENNLQQYPILLKKHLLGKLTPIALKKNYLDLAKLSLAEGDEDNAIVYLFKGEDPDEAIKLFLKKSDQISEENMFLFHRWLAELPESYCKTNPCLHYYRGLIKQQNGKFDEALLDFKIARLLFQNRQNQTGILKVDLQIAIVYKEKEDYPQTVALCKDLLTKVQISENNLLTIIYHLLGISLIELSNFTEGEEYLKTASKYCYENKIQEARLLNSLAFYLYTPFGKITQARESYEKALTISQEQNIPMSKVRTLLLMSYFYFEINNLTQAQYTLTEAEKISLTMDDDNILLYIQLLKIRNAISTGNLTEADKHLEKIQNHLFINVRQRAQLYLTYSAYYTTMHQIPKALFWGEKALSLAHQCKNKRRVLDSYLQMMHIHFIAGNYHDVLEIFTQIHNICEQENFSLHLTQALFYELAAAKQLQTLKSTDIQNFIDLIHAKAYNFLFTKYPFLTNVLMSDLQELLPEMKQGKILNANDSTLTEPTQNVSCTKPSKLLSIYMCDTFRFTVGNNTFTFAGLKNKKSIHLFKFLVLNLKCWIPQEKIIETFWPGLEPDKARQNLYVALYELRKELCRCLKQGKTQYILSRDGCYKFNTNEPFWLDLEDFITLYEEGNYYWEKNNYTQAKEYYLKAKKLYGNGLLPENSYEEWVNPHAEKYTKIYTTILIKLFTTEEDPPTAIQLGQEIINLEPYIDEVNIRLAKLLLETGQLKKAAQLYQKLKKLYYFELNMKLPVEIEEFFDYKI